jgi:hypothetical protein
MLRRALLVSALLLVPVAAAGADAPAPAPLPAELDIRGLKIGMPITSAPKSLHCHKPPTGNVATCLPEAGVAIKVEFTSEAAGERITSVVYSFFSRERLRRDTKVGTVLIAKYGQPKELPEGWQWRQGSTIVTASVPGDMQQAFLRLENPEFQKKAELPQPERATAPAAKQQAKPAKPPRTG